MSEHARLRELHEEEERIKLKMLQADAGLIGSRDILVTAERMDWMYHNPAQVQKEKEAEDFLLGKSISTPDEREEMKIRLGVGATAPGSLFLSSVTAQNEDTLRRLREDPLFMIRQAEHQQHRMDLARQKILGQFNTKPKTSRKEEKEREKSKEKSKEAKHISRQTSTYNNRRETSKRSTSFESIERERKRFRVLEGSSRRAQDVEGDVHYHKNDKKNPAYHGSRECRLNNCLRETRSHSTRRSNKKRYERSSPDNYKLSAPRSRADSHSNTQRSYRTDSPQRRGREIVNDYDSQRGTSRATRRDYSHSSADTKYPRDRIPKSPVNRLRNGRRDSSTRGEMLQTFSTDEASSSPERLDSRACAGVPRGPVLSREWKERLQDIEQVKKMESPTSHVGDSEQSNSAASSDSDVGPPNQMASSIEMRRQERNQIPLLKNRVEEGPSITADILPQSRPLQQKLLKKDERDDEDVFSACRRTLENDEQKRRKLKEMIQEGKKHEEEKSQKLNHLEYMDRLKEKLEAEKRATTAETGATVVNSFKTDAYMSEKQTLEERIKRYAARRKKDVVEDNLLDDVA